MTRGAIQSGCHRRNSGLFHHQHRALRELHDAIRAVADHALINSGMAFCADDQQLDIEFDGKIDNVAHGMPSDDMGAKLHKRLSFGIAPFDFSGQVNPGEFD